MPYGQLDPFEWMPQQQMDQSNPFMAAAQTLGQRYLTPKNKVTPGDARAGAYANSIMGAPPVMQSGGIFGSLGNLFKSLKGR